LPESRWRFQHEDRARRRGLILGKQEADGMSTLRGYLTPAARRRGGSSGQARRPGWPR
jgi:hypothetical protein